MHLFGRALKNSSTPASKQGIADQREPRSTIGDVAAGMARNIKDLEIESEVWKSNNLAAFDWVIDRRDALASWTENRYLAQTEKLIHSADVVTVVVGEKDCCELQPPFLENLDDGRGLTRIDDYRRW